MIYEFSYTAPSTVENLFDVLSEHSDEVMVLAGGTDLLPNIRNGIYKPKIVADIKKIAGFDRIDYDEKEGLSIRAAASISDLLRNPYVQEHYPLLIACARDLGSYQIRNRATVIGNIVNASPCADMAPALLCLEATVDIASREGIRSIPIRDFFLGVKKTVLKKNEIVVRIAVPVEKRGMRGSYKKLKRIQGHDLGIVGVALAIDAIGIRIAVSSAAPTPVVTSLLPLDIPIEDAVQSVLNIIAPISDVRCTKEYRQFMAGVFTRELLKEVRS